MGKGPKDLKGGGGRISETLWQVGWLWSDQKSALVCFCLFPSISCLFTFQINPTCLSCKKRNIFWVVSCLGKGWKRRAGIDPETSWVQSYRRNAERERDVRRKSSLSGLSQGTYHLLPSDAMTSVLSSSFHSSSLESISYESLKGSIWSYRSPA